MQQTLSMKNIDFSLSSKKEFYTKDKVFSLNNINIDINYLDFIGLVGNSGSGKSTLLKLIAGFYTPDQGSIDINGKTIFNKDQNISVDPYNRNIILVFQDYALFPHLTAIDNIKFAIRSKNKNTYEVDYIINLLRINKFLNLYPHQLSGGQQQRVALARALVSKPDILLLDEPFSSLHYSMHMELLNELSKILRMFKCTTIISTHHSIDILSVTDKVLVMNQGSIEQFSTPKEIYKNPQSLYVAKIFSRLLIFSTNFKIQLQSYNDLIFIIENNIYNAKYKYFIRLSLIKIVDEYTKSSLYAMVEQVIFLGDYFILKVSLIINKTLTNYSIDIISHNDKKYHKFDIIIVDIDFKSFKCIESN